MLVGLFRSNQPAVLLAVPLVVLALFLPAFWHTGPVPTETMPLAGLVEALCANAPGARELIGLLLIVLVSVQLVLLVNRAELMERPSHLTALLFPLILAGISSGPVYDPALLGMPLVLAAMRRTWSVPNTGAVLARLFDTGLLIGVAALCHLPFAFLLVAVWAGVSLVRPFAWREYVVPAVAVALVMYLCWAILKLSGHVPWHPLLTIADSAPAAFVFTLAQRWFLSAAGLLLLFGFMAFIRDHQRSVMRGKNIRSAFMAFVLGCAAIIAVPWAITRGYSSAVAAVPLSVLCGYALLRPRRAWLAEVMVLALVGLALWARWG